MAASVVDLTVHLDPAAGREIRGLSGSQPAAREATGSTLQSKRP